MRGQIKELLFIKLTFVFFDRGRGGGEEGFRGPPPWHTWFDDVIRRHCDVILLNSFAKSKFQNLAKNLNSKVFHKIKKLANMWITFNNSSDVMMMSFITKKETGSIRHLRSAILNYLNAFHFA